jgi:hypothetical protein
VTATILMEDDETPNTFSPSHETKVKKIVLDGGGTFITGVVQDNIFRSINFNALEILRKVASRKQLKIGSRRLTKKKYVQQKARTGWLWLQKKQ